MSKPTDFRVWSCQDAWTLAMQHIVEGEKWPTADGSKSYLGICSGARIYDHGDHLAVYHDEDDSEPWNIWYEEGGNTKPCDGKKDDALQNRIKTFVHDIAECKAILDILGEPVTESAVNVKVHAFIKQMKAQYEKELTEATGLPIEKFNI